MIHDQGGVEAAAEKSGPQAERLSKWAATMAVAKVTGKASRVSAFIVMWAAAMRDEGLDEFSITEYQRYWNESERRTYRLQAGFRDLWPEFETPNELAKQVGKHLDASLSRREIATLPTRLRVMACWASLCASRCVRVLSRGCRRSSSPGTSATRLAGWSCASAMACPRE